uniref:Uncharacterized protein n=1 Tax=Panagrolaimus davidi TaxID=227884 RepID=A0A914QS17_9BILA
MEQIQESSAFTLIPKDWETLNPESFIKLLNESSVKDIIDFARSSEAAGKFVKENIEKINDLNPFSIMIEDGFPTDDDRIYHFYITVRLGRKTANGTDEEKLLAKTSNDMREILMFLRPDILDIKLTYFSSFKDEIEQILGRSLTEPELTKLEWKSLHLQIDRERKKQSHLLEANGFTEADFAQAKENVLHKGNPENMPVDIYDSAYGIESGYEQLILKLNLMQATSQQLQDDLEHCRFDCIRDSVENELC